MEPVSFRVSVERSGLRWVVSVWEPGRGDLFARIEAPDLGTALRMALPFMQSVAEPDPFRMLVEGA
jgi:hypothetical protein